VFAGIVHSVFESWILSFSAPMLLTFFSMLVGFVKLDSMEKNQLSRRGFVHTSVPPSASRRVGAA
jgi:hypothetical protein